MKRSLAQAAACVALGAVSSAAAFPAEPFMHEGNYALAPFAFVRFCLDYPAECAPSPTTARVTLSDQGFTELTRVNRSVNQAIEPLPSGSEPPVWRLDVRAGHCNDYAVQKRHNLIQLGWPANALALAVVRTPTGAGHLVLTVRTDHGDFVLDNRRPNVVAWQRTGYTWPIRQSERNPQYWVQIDQGAAAFAHLAESGGAPLAPARAAGE